MNASGKKVAFLVDFDNVATDVIEQALAMVFKDYGAAHIRRAYCNAEQALREQNFLKRLGLRAIVNLAIGKNSTDIALAADAVDLAITEKPDVIVLVSSDSDFAPLVLRLREKGAWLRGFGQYGKTGDGVIQIYDQFNELAHGTGRAARDSAPAKPTGGGRNARRSGGRGAGPGRPQVEPPRGGPAARPPRGEASVALPAAPVADDAALLVALPPPAMEAVALPSTAPAAPPPAAEPVEAAAPAKPAGKAARKTAAKADGKPTAKGAAKRDVRLETKAAVKASTAAESPAEAAPAAAPTPKPAARAPAKAPTTTADDPQVAAAKEINAVLALLPKLADGQWHDLGAAAKVLKDAGLLAKSAPSTKLFRKHPHAFQLQPAKQPNQVRFAT
ncbi:NYN domain-containing protein [Roseateles cellulosilyticus]|uniref:NYN domain-containing protein n=1 Tax=Pelomonas cellulosilytica TaxID=2906762 RepID=A0ABS8Y067_9BURK|nr:NYN domain-containing protein [Pelomonas sp. P8]MCE4556915.1 NYN domain-containing protein [Pelomonas sp. P8]